MDVNAKAKKLHDLRKVLRCLIDFVDRTSTGYCIENTINNEVVDWPEIMDAYRYLRSPSETDEFFILKPSGSPRKEVYPECADAEETAMMKEEIKVLSSLYESTRSDIESALSVLRINAAVSRKSESKV